MKRQLFLSGPHNAELVELGRHIRRARLRRNMTQAELAERTRLARGTIVSLEAGGPGVSVGALVAVLHAMQLPGQLGDIAKQDDLGEELEELYGRRRAGNPRDVAGF